MALMKCEELAIGNGGDIVAEHLCFEIRSGDYLCVIGENGSGKSTLMRTVLGLQKPVSGTITFGDGLVQNEIGYLPQQTQVQRDFPASVREVVMSGCQGHMGLRPFYGKKEKAATEEALDRMDIRNLSKKCYRELSGGQQQRVLLARALCAASKLIVLDEPVTGLDPEASSEMYELVADLNRDGIAVLMVSHDLNSALRHATHVLHMAKNWSFETKEEYRGGVS